MEHIVLPLSILEITPTCDCLCLLGEGQTFLPESAPLCHSLPSMPGLLGGGRPELPWQGISPLSLEQPHSFWLLTRKSVKQNLV